MTVEEIVGANVRQIREELEMTQEQLGAALGEYLGKTWTRQAVSAAEKGRRNWRATDVMGVAMILEVSAGRLLFPREAETVDFPARGVNAKAIRGVVLKPNSPEAEETFQAMKAAEEAFQAIKAAIDQMAATVIDLQAAATATAETKTRITVIEGNRAQD